MLRRVFIIAGMFVVSGSIAVTVSAQGPGGGGGFFGRGGGSGAMLLAIPEVQKELNLSADQKDQLKTIADGIQEKIRASFTEGSRPDFQNMSDAERQKFRDDMQKRFAEVTKGVDEKVAGILDAKQNARLKELQLQREGARALLRPEVCKKLDLTEKQQADIKKIQDDARPTGGAFGRNMSDEDRKKLREKFEKAQKDSLAVLNDDQMLDWTNMCGKTFKFPEMQFRRGNRQGPPATPQP